MFVTPAFAQAAGSGAGAATSIFMQLVPFILIIAIMYFLVIRPQQQRVKAHQALVAGIKRGDVVVTAGGMIGKVVKVQENDEVLVEVADEVRVRFVKSTIADVRSRSEPEVKKTDGER